MMSLRLADSSVELSCWNLNRLEREGIREAIPWFDPNLQGAGLEINLRFQVQAAGQFINMGHGPFRGPCGKHGGN